MDTKMLAAQIVTALEDKKAEDIRIIDISGISVLADYFIIANGANRHQVQALADNVSEVCGRQGASPRQVEGYDSAGWILMDYADVVVHIFSREERSFYDLERIWRDGVFVDREQL